MSKFLRQAIVPIAAVAGAQLLNFVTVQATVHSEETGCRPGYYQPGDINRLADHAGSVMHNTLMGYPDADVAAQPAHPTDFTALQAAAAAQAAPSQATPAPASVANDGATTQTIWAREHRVPTAAEEEEYQSLRQMGMRRADRSVVPHRRRNVGL